MAAYIKTLKDASRENTIYPITRTEAVYRPDDATSVEEALVTLETEIYGLANMGLPSDSKPNQYIVTDGEGNAKWEDKLCWIESSEEVLVPETTMEFTGKWQCKSLPGIDTGNAPIGTDVIITFDGTEYFCKSKDTNGSGNTGIGNFNDWENDAPGEPFAVDLYGSSDADWYCREPGTHTISIRRVTETIHPISPELGGMPTLASDGSDAGKFIKANEDGTGYELDSIGGECDWNTMKNKPFGIEIAKTTIFSGDVDMPLVTTDPSYIAVGKVEVNLATVPEEVTVTAGGVSTVINSENHRFAYSGRNIALRLYADKVTFDCESFEGGFTIEDITIEAVAAVVKTIDSKYLPEVYATQEYVDEQLSTKSDSNHEHNELYYTEIEVNDLLNNKVNTTTLDNYYTKAEVEQFHDEITDYVDDEVAALVNSAPETLDTLGELAEAFQENKEVVDVLNEAIATKYSSSNPPPYPVTSVQGKTGAVNFTTETWTFTLSNGSTVTKKVLLG